MKGFKFKGIEMSEGIHFEGIHTEGIPSDSPFT